MQWTDQIVEGCDCRMAPLSLTRSLPRVSSLFLSLSFLSLSLSLFLSLFSVLCALFTLHFFLALSFGAALSHSLSSSISIFVLDYTLPVALFTAMALSDTGSLCCSGRNRGVGMGSGDGETNERAAGRYGGVRLRFGHEAIPDAASFLLLQVCSRSFWAQDPFFWLFARALPLPRRDE